MATVSLKQLLEAGVHFGHQTQRWNPKMARYIFGERNGIYIVDLEKTLAGIEKACGFLKQIAQQGGRILFVGTKKQAKEPIEVGAKRCGMPFVNQRWLGGMLTNFETIRKSVARLDSLEKMEEEGTYRFITKKEAGALRKERDKLLKVLAGVRDMSNLPQALFVIDPNMEEIAVLEASKLGLPIVALIDTNSDPDLITHIIPGNDDAIRAVKLICEVIANAIQEGREQFLHASGAGEKPEVVAEEVPVAEKAAAEQPAEAKESVAEPKEDGAAAEEPADLEAAIDDSVIDLEEKIIEKFSGDDESKPRALKAKVRKGSKTKE